MVCGISQVMIKKSSMSSMYFVLRQVYHEFVDGNSKRAAMMFGLAHLQSGVNLFCHLKLCNHYLTV